MYFEGFFKIFLTKDIYNGIISSYESKNETLICCNQQHPSGFIAED